MRIDPRRWQPQAATATEIRRAQADDVPIPARPRGLRGAPPSSECSSSRSGRRGRPRGSSPGQQARIVRCGRSATASRASIRGGESGDHAVAIEPEQGVAQGLPRRHIRCRRFVWRRGGRSESRTKTGRSSIGRRRVLSGSASTRLSSRRRPNGVTMRADPRRPEGTTPVLPPHRSGNHPQALDRRRRAEVRTPGRGSSRSSRSAWSCRCTTSRPAPATSSPTG